MGQTVNLLAYAFGGSNPSLPTSPCKASDAVSKLFLFPPLDRFRQTIHKKERGKQSRRKSQNLYRLFIFILSPVTMLFYKFASEKESPKSKNKKYDN